MADQDVHRAGLPDKVVELSEVGGGEAAVPSSAVMAPGTSVTSTNRDHV